MAVRESGSAYRGALAFAVSTLTGLVLTAPSFAKAAGQEDVPVSGKTLQILQDLGLHDAFRLFE